VTTREVIGEGDEGKQKKETRKEGGYDMD